jgi:isochorismate hydrolase
MARSPFLLDRTRAGLLVIDIQEKLLAVMAHPEMVVENTLKLIKGFQIMNLPLFVTEQYPQGIGKTEASLKKVLKGVKIQDKLTFSCCGIAELIHSFRTKKIVIRDAVSSRKETDVETALGRMALHGVSVTTTEMVLFELLERAGTDAFKEVAKLIK